MIRSRDCSAAKTSSRTMLAGLLVLACLACGSEPPPPQPDPPPVTPVEPLPADFVICVDNSRSIRRGEQVLVRETTMLVADLASFGDRVSVIAFGEDAELIASTQITKDEDRKALKLQIAQGLDFSENYSDIRAGLKEIVQNSQTVFRPEGVSLRIPIILSDGKLEPADGDFDSALSNLLSIVKEPLGNTPIYAVVLGETSAHHVIAPGLTGLILMRDHIARSARRYFHAKSLDQLLDMPILILERARGVASLAEQDGSRFKIDDSVEMMTLMVRKRSADGIELCVSDDISLVHLAGAGPEPDKATVLTRDSSPANTYWSRDYQYFDLIAVRDPAPGLWEVRLATGDAPRILSKIDTPLELRLDVRDLYYLNESAFLYAWIYDRRLNGVSRRPYAVDVHLVQHGIYERLEADTTSAAHSLALPGRLTDLLPDGLKAGSVEIEVIAQLRIAPDRKELDPWFVRSSQPFAIELADPIVDWVVEKNRSITPRGRYSAGFGAFLEQTRKHSPEFETPPDIEVIVEQVTEDGPVRVAESWLSKRPEGTGVAYSLDLGLEQRGTYHYAYRLTGNTRLGGSFELRSPWYQIEVVSLIPLLVALLLLATIAVILWIGNATARLKVRIAATAEDGAVGTQRLNGRRCLFEESIGDVELDRLRLTLDAKRYPVLGKWAILRVTGEDARVNSHTVPQGRPIRLDVGRGAKHTVRFTRADGVEVTLKLELRI